MTRYFCTYFDDRYANRGLVLYQTLWKTCPDFHLWVLCLNDECASILQRLALPQLSTVTMRDFEADDPALLAVKPTRSLVEYFFTCTPSLPLHVFRIAPEVDLLTYVDSDLCFHRDPAPIYQELEGHSIGVIGHRFAARDAALERAGRFNVGWVSFRRDAQGLACLDWWRARCLEWCYDRFEPGRFADQGYLDYWPDMFDRLRVIEHKGANLAPWNIANYDLAWDGEAVLVDGQPLLFFHFHGLKRAFGPVYNLNLANYGAGATGVTRRRIYVPYLRDLRQADRTIGTMRSKVVAPRANREKRDVSDGGPPQKRAPLAKRAYWRALGLARQYRPDNYALAVGPPASDMRASMHGHRR